MSVGKEPRVIAEEVMALSITATDNGVAFTTVVGVVDRYGRLEKRTFTEEVSFRN